MKTRKLAIAFVSLIVLMSCSSNRNLIGFQKTGNNDIDQPLANQNETADISPQVTGKKVLSKTVNDIKIEITSAKVIDMGGVEVGICYTTPDNGEWRPMPGHLFYGEYEIYPDEIQFLEGEITADEDYTGTRCALIRYRINDLNTLTTPIDFSILQIYAPSREQYTPCQELQVRLDTNSRAIAYGLKASCVESEDGKVYLTLLRYDPSLAEEEANKRLDEIAKAEVVGPWEFTINEIER